jgi:hypothetical protein
LISGDRSIMSGVVKIEINESADTLKILLQKAKTPQEKERLQTRILRNILIRFTQEDIASITGYDFILEALSVAGL